MELFNSEICEKVLTINAEDVQKCIDKETYKDYQNNAKIISDCLNNFKESFVHAGRYLFVKAVESRISREIYSGTKREKAKEIFYFPEAIEDTLYRTNLPQHLEKRVNSYIDIADTAAREYRSLLKGDFSKGNAVKAITDLQMLGEALCCRDKAWENRIGFYSNKDLLSVSEIQDIAVNTFCSWLHGPNAKVAEFDSAMDTFANVSARLGDTHHLVLVRSSVAPAQSTFMEYELEGLYAVAQQTNAVACIADVTVRSENDGHFKDGVILDGDKPLVKIISFNQISK